MKRKKKGPVAILKNMILTSVMIVVLIYASPLIFFTLMDIAMIPERIAENKMNQARVELAEESAVFQVGEEKIAVDTMSVILYGLKELDGDKTQPTQYEYIGGHNYHRGYSVFALQLKNMEKDGKSYEIETDVVDFFNEIITIINNMDLDYKYSDFPEEYYFGFEDDTKEAGMSVTFFSWGKLALGMEEAQSVTFRLLLGNSVDSDEYQIGEAIKNSLIGYMESSEELYQLLRVQDVVNLINSGSRNPVYIFDEPSVTEEENVTEGGKTVLVIR